MTLLVLCILVALFHLGDILSTQRALRSGGFEANPVLARLQRTLPGRWTWLWVPKLALIAAQWAVLWWLWPNDWLIAVTCIGFIVHGWAISHNLEVASK